MEKEMSADVLYEQITREWKDAVQALQRIENTLTLEYLRFKKEHEREMNYAEFAKNRVSYLKSELMQEYFDSVLAHISTIKEEEMCAEKKEKENVLNNSHL